VKLAVRHKKKGVLAAQVISSNRSILKKKKTRIQGVPSGHVDELFPPLEEDRLLPSAHGSLRMNWFGLTL
jgi:hypothetical protein